MADPISLVATAATVLGGAQAVKSLTTKPPKPPGPTPMPNQQDTIEAKRRQMAAMQARGGRASTILTQDETLG